MIMIIIIAIIIISISIIIIIIIIICIVIVMMMIIIMDCIDETISSPVVVVVDGYRANYSSFHYCLLLLG